MLLNLFRNCRKAIISKNIEKQLDKKGYKTSIHFDEFTVDKHDEHTNVKIKMEITLNSKDYKKILKKITR